jgi:hypothetical protein
VFKLFADFCDRLTQVGQPIGDQELSALILTLP